MPAGRFLASSVGRVVCVAVAGRRPPGACHRMRTFPCPTAAVSADQATGGLRRQPLEGRVHGRCGAARHRRDLAREIGEGRRHRIRRGAALNDAGQRRRENGGKASANGRMLRHRVLTAGSRWFLHFSDMHAQVGAATGHRRYIATVATPVAISATPQTRSRLTQICRRRRSPSLWYTSSAIAAVTAR